MLVKDLMTENPLCAQLDEPAVDARERMVAERIQCLPVVSKRGKLRGVLTNTDVAGTIAPEARVEQIMTQDVLATPSGMDLHSASALMAERSFHHLVVVEGNRVVGVMSAFDVLRAVGDGRLVADPDRSG